MTPEEQDNLGEELSAFLDGELGQDESAQIERLLSTDEQALCLLEEVRAAQAAARSLNKVPAPSDVLEEIMDRVERLELLGPAQDDIRLARHKVRPIRSALALAAVVLVAVSGGLYVSVRTGQHKGSASLEDTEVAAHAGQNSLSNGAPDQEVAAVLDKLFTPKPEDLLAHNSMGNQREGPIAPSAHDDWASANVAPYADDVEMNLDGAEETVTTGARMREAMTSMPGDDIEDDWSGPALPDRASLNEANSTLVQTTVPSRRKSNVSPPLGIGRALREQARGVSADDGFVGPPNDLADNEMRTLEQKYAHGFVLSTVKTHQFTCEPVRLSLLLAGETAEQEFAAKMCALLTSQGVKYVHSSTVSTSSMIAYEGVAFINFHPRTPQERQFIVRLSPPLFVETIKYATDATNAKATLCIGECSVQGQEAVNALAASIAGKESPPRNSQSPVDEGEQREITNEGDPLCLMKILQDFVLATSFPLGGFQSDTEVACGDDPVKGDALYDGESDLITVVVKLESTTAMMEPLLPLVTTNGLLGFDGNETVIPAKLMP